MNHWGLSYRSPAFMSNGQASQVESTGQIEAIGNHVGGVSSKAREGKASYSSSFSTFHLPTYLATLEKQQGVQGYKSRGCLFLESLLTVEELPGFFVKGYRQHRSLQNFKKREKEIAFETQRRLPNYHAPRTVMTRGRRGDGREK